MKGKELAQRVWKRLDQYKYVLLVALVGVLLLLWPGGEKTAVPQSAPSDRSLLELKLEEALSQIEGVGKVTVVLTGQDTSPGYQGALVVAAGGDDPTVKLELSRILSALTGLGADKITISKGK